jgi:UDP-N-acetyl-D-glucosamine dehydrogenase
MDLMIKKGADVGYHDPYVPFLKRSRHYDFHLQPVPLTREEVRRWDAVVIATDHTVFDYDLVVDASSLVIDTRNATCSVTKGREKIVRA